jgi:hypothetical protein
MLQRPAVPQALKQWLIKCNLDICASQLTLTRSGCALHYPLDITACQNDKLIYIAPPKCDPSSIDKFEGPRIQLVTRLRSTLDFPDGAFPSESVNRAAVEKLINSLREQQGLKPRKTFDLKVLDDQEYLAKVADTPISISTVVIRGLTGTRPNELSLSLTSRESLSIELRNSFLRIMVNTNENTHRYGRLIPVNSFLRFEISRHPHTTTDGTQ